jgi:hypothetical protein
MMIQKHVICRGPGRGVTQQIRQLNNRTMRQLGKSKLELLLSYVIRQKMDDLHIVLSMQVRNNGRIIDREDRHTLLAYARGLHDYYTQV